MRIHIAAAAGALALGWAIRRRRARRHLAGTLEMGGINLEAIASIHGGTGGDYFAETNWYLAEAERHAAESAGDPASDRIITLRGYPGVDPEHSPYRVTLKRSDDQ